MKYVLLILVGVEIVLAALFLIPSYENHEPQPDAFVRNDIDPSLRPPEETTARPAHPRRTRWLLKTTVGVLLIGNTAGIVVALRGIRDV